MQRANIVQHRILYIELKGDPMRMPGGRTGATREHQARDTMALNTRQFVPAEIDQAGSVLVLETDLDIWSQSARMINLWRASHAGPLNTFRMNLRPRVHGRGFIAQRLKRLTSIISKLERLPRIRLSRMQDIGGCRAVVRTADDAYNLASDFVASRIRHELVRHKNFIEYPKQSGYRGIHLVYDYNSDRSTKWQGLKTEIQIRSRLQHQWATAVETVGTFTRDDLKSNLGNAIWLRFFALMSTVIAKREGTPCIPNTPTSRKKLVTEIKECDQELGISERLAAFQSLTLHLQGFIRRDQWIGLELDLANLKVTGVTFKPRDLESATTWYVEREVDSRDDSQVEVVLVSAASLSALRRAYPNYLADLDGFRSLVQETVANR